MSRSAGSVLAGGFTSSRGRGEDAVEEVDGVAEREGGCAAEGGRLCLVDDDEEACRLVISVVKMKTRARRESTRPRS